MKRYILTFGFLLSALYEMTAQAVVSGRVLEEGAKVAIPYVTVAVFAKKDNKLITGAITDDNGRYELSNIPQGDYLVTYNYIGYDPQENTLLVGELNNTYDLGKVYLKPSETALDEVVVEGKHAAVSGGMEKKNFSIANNISQAGGSVLEAMRNLPGVSINQDGKVLLRGSDKVTVLIDGKQSSLTGFGSQKGLDNIPASNIERIEIINNPSAKYDSQGMAGIVNVIYKKDLKTGWNGDISFNYGVGELTSRRANLPNIMDKYSWTPKYNPALSLNYRTEKVNFFVQSDLMFRKKVNENSFTTRTYDNNSSEAINSQFLENRSQQIYNIKGGVDYYIDDKNELTLYGLLEQEYHIDRGDVPFYYAATGERKRLWTWSENESINNINYGLNYKHKFEEPGHKIDVVGLYSRGVEDELFPFTDASALMNSTDSTHLISKERVVSLAVDYVKPLSSGRLEGGTKVQLRAIPISYQLLPGVNSVLDPNLGTWSEYKEDIYALYGNYIYESKSLDVEGGLRIENAVITYNIDPSNIYYTENEYYNNLSLFPNVRFTYKMDEKNKFSLFYNRRVDRPSEFELRPFPKYDDPEVLKTGNPYLKPQFTQVFEAAYKTHWGLGSVYLSGYYKRITDLYTRIYTNSNDGSGVINSIPQNLAGGSNIGSELVLEQQLTSKWDINANINWYRNEIDAFAGTSNYPYPQTFNFDKSISYTWNMKINSQLKLPKNFDIQGTFVYYAPDIIPQGRVEQRYSFDMGIRKKAFKDKLEFSLSATDLFNTFAIKQTINGAGFALTSENYYETQTVKIGVKYKF